MQVEDKFVCSLKLEKVTVWEKQEKAMGSALNDWKTGDFNWIFFQSESLSKNFFTNWILYRDDLCWWISMNRWREVLTWIRMWRHQCRDLFVWNLSLNDVKHLKSLSTGHNLLEFTCEKRVDFLGADACSQQSPRVEASQHMHFYAVGCIRTY